jgi:hypothetical protein
MKKAKQTAALIVIGCAPFTAKAVTFTLTGPNTIGSVAPGTETSTDANADYINALIFRSNNNATTSPYDQPGQTYLLINDTGTTLTFADPTAAVDTGAVGGDDMVTVSGYEYLVVKYGGANGSSVVFNVADISGDVTVPESDATGGNANKYLLFNAAATTNVPDGGTSAILLGVGFLSLGAIRRKLN